MTIDRHFTHRHCTHSRAETASAHPVRTFKVGTMLANKQCVPRKSLPGFTLIELMLVVSILGVLASMAVTGYDISTARAKRTEAYILLDGVYTAQQVYFADHGRFASSFDQLGFDLKGGTRVSPTELKGRRYHLSLSQPEGDKTYYCSATGNVDSDPWPDVIVTQVDERP